MASVLFLTFILLLSSKLGLSDAAAAVPCPTDSTTCQLPDCLCSSTSIPGGLVSTTVPQIVMVTFDDPVNVINYPLYEELLLSRTNPNNASVSATFFVSHQYNDYSLTHQLWRRGHEIGLQSISSNSNSLYWRNLNESGWTAEITDQIRQMAFLGNFPESDIRGMRAPGLQGGGDQMYSAISSDLQWECSMPTYNFRQPGLWPYTNDYKSIQDCQIPPCPTESFPGFWTVPIINNLGANLFPCPMFDACQPPPTTEAETYELLKRNFDDQYTLNRAPFGLFTKSSWLQGPDPEYEERKKGFSRFLDYLESLEDVYLVSISQALEWVKNPTALNDISSFAPWAARPVQPDECTFPRSCRYESMYMMTCSALCPVNYPWIHNPLGDETSKLIYIN